MFLGNIIDKFLDKHCLSYTGTAKESDFTTFGIRFEQVDYFDTSEEYFLHSCQIFKFGRVTVDGTCTIESLHAVDRVTHYVHQSSFNLFAYRHRDRASGGIHLHAAL